MPWVKLLREPPRGPFYINLDTVMKIRVDSDGAAWIDYANGEDSDIIIDPADVNRLLFALDWLAMPHPASYATSPPKAAGGER